jgi:hypothetical protein
MAKNNRLEKYKPYIQLGITGLIEIFTAAVGSCVVDHVDGGKFSKFGAKLGGALIGLMLGGKTADYICDEMEDFMDGLDEFKEAIDDAKESE